jgi:hypothetical protein
MMLTASERYFRWRGTLLAKNAERMLDFALTFSHFIIKQLRSNSCNSSLSG